MKAINLLGKAKNPLKLHLWLKKLVMPIHCAPVNSKHLLKELEHFNVSAWKDLCQPGLPSGSDGCHQISHWNPTPSNNPIWDLIWMDKIILIQLSLSERCRLKEMLQAFWYSGGEKSLEDWITNLRPDSGHLSPASTRITNAQFNLQSPLLTCLETWTMSPQLPLHNLVMIHGINCKCLA